LRKASSGCIIKNKSGGRGALNPESKEAQDHAKLYYEEIRKRRNDVNTISGNIIAGTGFTP
jgi:hypothetical protein